MLLMRPLTSVPPGTATTCPTPPPGPPPAPAPIPPGPARDFSGDRIGAAVGAWWSGSVSAPLVLGPRLGSVTGYGTWTEAVAAATAASAGTAAAVAVCDDRGRLYLHVVRVGSSVLGPGLRMGSRGELGYRFTGDAVRGLVDGALLASRGDCLEPWVPRPRPRPEV